MAKTQQKTARNDQFPRESDLKHLALPTRRWVQSTLAEYEIEEHQARTLVSAGVFWDRAEQALLALEANGLTFLNRHNEPKPRPEIQIERDSRLAFARCVRELGLPIGEPEAPRVPRTGGH